jgi:hypothetical protein
MRYITNSNHEKELGILIAGQTKFQSKNVIKDEKEF